MSVHGKTNKNKDVVPALGTTSLFEIVRQGFSGRCPFRCGQTPLEKGPPHPAPWFHNLTAARPYAAGPIARSVSRVTAWPVLAEIWAALPMATAHQPSSRLTCGVAPFATTSAKWRCW